MKKKKSLLILISILIIIILAIIIFFVIKHFNNVVEPSNTVENENTINNGYSDTLPTTNIQSSEDNPIEMNDIEATNIEIINNYGELQVLTTLKNNSNETINGFFIELALLDENDNTITSIAQNTEETIEPNNELTITNNVTGIDNNVSITNAKIISIEKNTIQDSIENSFNEVEGSIQNIEN